MGARGLLRRRVIRHHQVKRRRLQVAAIDARHAVTITLSFALIRAPRHIKKTLRTPHQFLHRIEPCRGRCDYRRHTPATPTLVDAADE